MTVIEQFRQEKSARDEVFNYVKGLLNEKPTRILEIGCLRDLNSRAGDGWSTLHWADYVNRFGGQLTICDINPSSAQLCSLLIEQNFPACYKNFVAHAKDGSPFITPSFDFIYLDGGDDPMETLIQFEKCDRDNQIILIDDFHTKGYIVSSKYFNKFLFNFSNGHKMALYGKNVQAGTMQIIV